ncbi:MAG: ketose-bisphosphate aldolase [Christensenellales bacterium]
MVDLFKNMMQDALKGNYAIGAFNFVNMETLYAICDTAQELNAPVICAVSESALKYMGEEMFIGYKTMVRKKYSVPICFHLDHGKSVEICKRAVDIGFDSVMIDLSALPYEENVKGTKEVVDYAHRYHIGVEAELGTLSGVEDDVSSEKTIYTNPKDVKDFYEKTGVDALAIAIGTSHGAYKFNGEAKLRFDILEQVQAEVPNLPLVLHGASSIDEDLIEKINNNGGQIKGAKGIPYEFLSKASTMNICKINIDSDLRIAMTAEIREYLNLHPDCISPRDYLRAGQKAQCEKIAFKICNIFHSDGKV